MAETTLKPLLNEATVIGRLKEVNLELGETQNGKENIKGNVIVLVKEKDKKTGEIREHDIRVRVYSNKYKKDGKENGLYKGYEKVLNEYKSIAETGDKDEADLVRVNGSIELNEYIGQDGATHRHNNISGKFFHRITPDKVKKERGPIAKVKVQGVVTGIKDITGEDGLPTGEKRLEFYNVDFYGKLQDNAKPIIPIEAIIPEDIAEKFEELYDVGDTGQFTLKVNNYAEEVDEEELQEEVDGFGDTEDLVDVKTRFVNNLEVVGGSLPFDNGREYDEEQIEEAKQWRKKALDDLEDGYTPTATPKDDNAFGEDSKEDSSKDKSDDISDADMDDLDF